MRDLRLDQNEKASTSNTKQSMVVQENKDFTREALQVHNDLRKEHGVEPLKLNNDLSKLAQQWGNTIVFLSHLTSCSTFLSKSSSCNRFTCT